MRSRSPAGIPRLYVQVMDEGNSLARGQAGGDPSSTSWLDILATLMTGSRVRQWTNGGINGASTSQLISSDYSYFNDEKAKAIAGFYKVGILWEFTNDLAEIWAGYKSTTAAQALTKAQTWVGMWKTVVDKVIVMDVIARSDFTTDQRARVAEFNASLASGWQSIGADGYVCLSTTFNNYNDQAVYYWLNGQGGQHLTTYGNGLLAALIQPELTRVIATLPAV